MIERIIEWSARNRLIVLLAFAALTAAGIWAAATTPVDAIPDLSENQVIVFTEWMGRSPKTIEEQVTYPLVTTLQGLPDVRAVRANSMFGMSFIFVIFDDDADLYFARAQVRERLSVAQAKLPPGVVATLGPDGTGVGHVFWYTVESGDYDLGTLRTLQDWYIRQKLAAVEGVAEVASVGGFVKQYQIDVDPEQMRAYGLAFDDIVTAVQRSNNEVGGKLIETSGSEAFVRGQGYITDRGDVERIVVRTTTGGVPVRLDQVATVQIGGDIRRGSLEKDGRGEVVGGIIVMRQGANAGEVIDAVKAKIAEMSPGLPKGVRIVPSYDREPLIDAAVATLTTALVEEALVVTLVVLVFILHLRSAIRILIGFPVSVLLAFLLMRAFDITSNIMSLGGIAIAIGEVVDASIVIVENAYRNIAEAQQQGRTLTREEYYRLTVVSAKQVGRAIFFSAAIMVISFLPVFMLEGQEGKLFHPLAWTKTFVIAASAIVAITLTPLVMTFFMGGRFRSEEHHPVMRFFTRIYEPVLRWCLKHRTATIALNVVALLAAIPMALSTGSEFMPPLDEGSLLFMPVLLPDASIGEVNRILQIQDRIIAEYPEVDHVLGKAGRAETATDNAPLSMIETVVLLKPRDEWRPGITKQRIIGDLDHLLRIPGVRNGWTQPIINRINMLSTGVRTDLGVKIFGPDLDTLEHFAIRAEEILKRVDGAADVTADRVQGGRFLDITVDEAAIARYGINIADVQMLIETALGGENIGQVIEGRARFPIRVRYERELRDNIEAIERILVPIRSGTDASAMTAGRSAEIAAPAASGMGGMSAGSAGGGDAAAMPSGSSSVSSAPFTSSVTALAAAPSRAYVQLSDVARVELSAGPSMIASEGGELRSVVFLNVRGRDMGGHGRVRRRRARGASARARASDRLHVGARRTVREQDPRGSTIDDRRPGRLPHHLPPPLHDDEGRQGGGDHHAVGAVRAHRWRLPAVPARLQLLGRGVGRLHLALRRRGADGRRHGRLSASGARPPPRRAGGGERSRHLRRDDGGSRAAASAEADDGGDDDDRSRADHVLDGSRLGRHEAIDDADDRRPAHLGSPCADHDTGALHHDEGAGAAERTPREIADGGVDVAAWEEVSVSNLPRERYPDSVPAFNTFRRKHETRSHVGRDGDRPCRIHRHRRLRQRCRRQRWSGLHRRRHQQHRCRQRPWWKQRGLCGRAGV
jgi:copper/silver efflux system protein